MDNFTCDENKILLTRLNIHASHHTSHHAESLPKERELKQNIGKQEVIALFDIQQIANHQFN